MKNFYLTLAFFCGFVAYGQLNMTQKSNLSYQTLHSTELNDIWGYVDELGNEYALVGAQKGTSVVDVTNPTLPVEKFWEPGLNSVWRDLKTWGDYAYVTTEALNGLLVIDLSPLPQSSALTTSYYTGPSGNEWQSAHNLYIDSNGYAYIFGANRGVGGVIILDVHTDPMNPVEVGVINDWYVHDGYARNDTLFCANISDGFFTMYDIQNKANPILLGTKTTPNNFAHNIWPRADGKVVFTTDEKPGAYIASYDVSDQNNIVELDRIQSSPGSQVIPHNAHVLGDFVITSYYKDGITVHDVTHPHNMIEVGNFDSSPLSGNGYNGCWGVYPFLPSGNIIASDIENGLFVLGVTYQKGCYLEGVVRDAVTNAVISGAKAKITSLPEQDLTDATGAYAIGVAGANGYSVNYSKVGYAAQTVQVNMIQGVVTTQDIQLVPLPPYNLTVKVVLEGTNTPITNAQVRLKVPDLTHNGVTNGLGEEDFTLYYEQNYDVFVGKWGYYTHCTNQQIDATTGTITVELKPGIFDDFTFDFGWQVSGNAETGAWTRAIPIGGSGSANPEFDAEYDCSDYCYVTGNQDTHDPDADDVDNGTAILKSPSFDLTSYSNPHVNFSRYFYNFYGPNGPADDKLKVIMSNGNTSVLIDEIASDPSQFYTWVSKSIRVSDFMTPTANMSLTITTSDLPNTPNITEAGFDYFYVSNSNVTALNEEENNLVFTLYPNPVNSQLSLQGLSSGSSWTIVSMEGKVVRQGRNENSFLQLNISELESGMYLFVQNGHQERFIKK